jgi:hypothetical protein
MDPGSNFDFMKWIANHRQAQTRPTLDKVIEALKGQGIQTLGATGYCFGGEQRLEEILEMYGSVTFSFIQVGMSSTLLLIISSRQQLSRTLLCSKCLRTSR